METTFVEVEPYRIDHDMFGYCVRKGDMTFRIVNFRHDKLLFGKQVWIYKLLFYSQFLPLLILPFIAYYLNNWWVLFGIPISVLAAGFASRKIVQFTFAILVFCIVYWIIKGFSFTQLPTIFFFTAWFTHAFVAFNHNYQSNQARKNVLNDEDIYNALIDGNNLELKMKLTAEAN